VRRASLLTALDWGILADQEVRAGYAIEGYAQGLLRQVSLGGAGRG